MKLTFLGTGGGRHTLIRQLRQTGGMYLTADDFSCYIDPGPGALVHAREKGIPLEDLDAVIVTHAHLDHDGDMKAVIEAMTGGGETARGTVLAAASVFEGADVPERYVQGSGVYGGRIDPSLDGFHRELVAERVVLEDGMTPALGQYTMECLEVEHSDPRTVAFILENEQRVGFVTDTELFPGLIDFFQDCDVLVVNVMRPRAKEWKGHLTVADAATLLDEVDPAVAVVQHFGLAMIYASVRDEMDWLQDQVECDVIVAEDGMTIDLTNPQQGLDRFV